MDPSIFAEVSLKLCHLTQRLGLGPYYDVEIRVFPSGLVTQIHWREKRILAKWPKDKLWTEVWTAEDILNGGGS